MYQIFVPSRGRAGRSATADLLQRAGVPFTFMLEEPELLAYQNAYGDACAYVTLPQPEQGIGYSRYHVLDLARRNGLDWFWMLDDDITGLYRGTQGATQHIRARLGDTKSVLKEAEAFVATLPETVALATFVWREHMWQRRNPYDFNQFGAGMVLVHADRSHPCQYRQDFRTLEDVEFSLQLWYARKHVVQLNRFGFGTKTKHHDGGISTDTTDKLEQLRRALIIQQRYGGPDIIRPRIGPTGDVWVTVKWKLVRAAHA